MATIGLKYPVYAKYEEDEVTETVTYSAGRVMGKAISFRSTLDIAETPLYGDDGIAEIINEFTGGKLIINVDDLDDETNADLLGHTIKENTLDGTTVKEIVKNGGDMGAYVGSGAYATKIKGGKRFFRALFFHKVQFGAPAETFETKEKSVKWQTPTIEGTIMKNIKGDWGSEITVADEEMARKWLRQKANINV
jgi:hypothetical protein